MIGTTELGDDAVTSGVARCLVTAIGRHACICVVAFVIRCALHGGARYLRAIALRHRTGHTRVIYATVLWTRPLAHVTVVAVWKTAGNIDALRIVSALNTLVRYTVLRITQQRGDTGVICRVAFDCCTIWSNALTSVHTPDAHVVQAMGFVAERAVETSVILLALGPAARGTIRAVRCALAFDAPIIDTVWTQFYPCALVIDTGSVVAGDGSAIFLGYDAVHTRVVHAMSFVAELHVLAREIGAIYGVARHEDAI